MCWEYEIGISLLGGVAASVLVLVGDRILRRYRLTWQCRWIEGKYRITLIMKTAPFDLLKIAESMLK